MNNRVLHCFPGQYYTFLSVDSVAELSQQSLYPIEYLNSLNLSGLPPHQLNLKIEIPIMLGQNMDPMHGHCNGTRYIIRGIHGHYIEAEIACGEYAGNTLLIPRITLSPTDDCLPFTLRHRQFPVHPAFAISINKAQGQTLQCAGVWLNQPVFNHGQLYIAESRCGDRNNIRFCVSSDNNETNNIVYNDIVVRTN